MHAAAVIVRQTFKPFLPFLLNSGSCTRFKSNILCIACGDLQHGNAMWTAMPYPCHRPLESATTTPSVIIFWARQWIQSSTGAFKPRPKCWTRNRISGSLFRCSTKQHQTECQFVYPPTRIPRNTYPHPGNPYPYPPKYVPLSSEIRILRKKVCTLALL